MHVLYCIYIVNNLDGEYTMRSTNSVMQFYLSLNNVTVHHSICRARRVFAI